MKICVYFQPTIENDNFEGMRLRKNIKGALELHNIPYAKNLLDTYDIVHFMSLDDEAKIIDENGNGVPNDTPGKLAVRGITGCKYLNRLDKQKEYV